jgi:hypothetical protein
MYVRMYISIYASGRFSTWKELDSKRHGRKQREEAVKEMIDTSVEQVCARIYLTCT